VTTSHSSDAFGFREQLSDLCQRKLLAAIEKLFDAKAPENKVIRAGKLTIDLGELSFKNWESEFIEGVIEELTKRISAAVPMTSSDADEEENVVVQISEEENVMQSIFYFLKFGSLPWFSVIESRDELQDSLKKVVQTPDFVDGIRKLLHSDATIVERLLNQFDVTLIELLLANDFIGALKSSWYPIFDQLKFGEARKRRIFYQALLLCLDEKSKERFMVQATKNILTEFTKEEIENFISQIENNDPVIREILRAIPQKDLTIDLIKERKKEKPVDPAKNDQDKVIFVDNAGLVILHPFLAGLFANVGYTEKDEWISEEVQHRAHALTQYMITGNEEFPEFDLMLNKLLIGYPLEKTLPSEIVLSDFEKEEVNDLLKSVIKHWTVLKNTSVEGLQSTFLKREGKLSQNENGWLLQVEQKTVDILMNKLPWGISIIKTPWMDGKMHVEWN